MKKIQQRFRISILSYLISYSFLPGLMAQSWSPGFRMPGVRGAYVNTMIESGGYLYAGAAHTATFGGDLAGLGWARFDGESWQGIGKIANAFTIYTIADDAGGNLYVGGTFISGINGDNSQVVSRGILRWNLADSVWESLGSGVGGVVHDIAVSTDYIYVAGSFKELYNANDTIVASNVGRFNLNTQTWDNMDGGVSGGAVSSVTGTAYAIEQDAAGNVFVGGNIGQAGSTAVYSVGIWNESTGWSNAGTGLPVVSITDVANAGTVRTLLLDPVTNRMYAGGVFGDSNNSNRNIAYWNGTEWKYIPGIGKPSGFFQVDALFIDQSTDELWVGGNFYDFYANPDLAGNSIGRYDLTSNTWFDKDAVMHGGLLNGAVNAIAFYQGEPYVGGSFRETKDGRFVQQLAKYTSEKWDVMGDGLNSAGMQSYDVEKYGNEIILGGSFNGVGGINVQGLSIYHSETGWRPLANTYRYSWSDTGGGTIYAMKVDGDKLYVGGNFERIESLSTNGLAAYDFNTQTWSGWGTGTGSFFEKIEDIEVFQGDLYVAGTFTSIDGAPAKYVAKLNAQGTWENLGDFDNYAVALYNDGDSVLYIGGAFASVDGNGKMRRVTAWNGSSLNALAGGLWASNTQIDFLRDPVSGNLLVGNMGKRAYDTNGNLLDVGLLPIWTGSEWQVGKDFTGNFLSIQKLFLTPSQDIVVAGEFDFIDGVQVDNIARIKPDGTVEAFQEGGVSGATVVTNRPNVNDIVLLDSKLYMAGAFVRSGSQQSHGFAAYDISAWLPAPPEPDFFSLGNDTTIINGYILKGPVNAQVTGYEWSSGNTSPYQNATVSGSYALKITTLDKKTYSDTIKVTVNEVGYRGGIGGGYGQVDLMDLETFYAGGNGGGYYMADTLNDLNIYRGGIDGGYFTASISDDLSFYRGGPGGGYVMVTIGEDKVTALVSDKIYQEDIVVYPNPVDQILNFKLPEDFREGKIHLYNQNGLLLKVWELEKGFQRGIYSLSLEDLRLNKAVYIYHVVTENEVIKSGLFLKK